MDQTTAPARPNLPGQTAPSAELRDLVKDFQSARESFRKQQQDLLIQLKAASEAEREAVRQQLKENLDAWLEQQKAQMQDIRDQARELRDNVPAIRDVVNSGTGEGRGR
jgi:F0F1-type ATP synthase membrane subunit b/b'